MFRNLFKSSTLYLRIYRNKIEIQHIENDVIIKKYSSTPFSTDTAILADYLVFEDFLNSTIKELTKRNSVPTSRMLIQPMEGEITPVIKRALFDSCEHSGAKLGVLYDKKDLLTKEMVLSKIKSA